MITLGAALTKHWQDDAAIAAIVGEGDAARIYPSVAPERAELPYVVYTRLSAEQVEGLGGGQGLAITRIRVDCWAATVAEADALGTLLRRSLQALEHEQIAADLSGGLWIDSGAIDDGPSDVTSPPIDGTDEWEYGVRHDATVIHAVDQ